MTARRWLIGLATALAASAAIAAQPQSAAQDKPPAAAEAAKKIAACEGQKFEFQAGEPRPTKITLCSDKGASAADLVRMFESAVATIEKLDKLPKERRDSLVAQIRAKIGKVQVSSAAVLPLPVVDLPAPRPITEVLPPPEYAQLPPLPPPEYAQLPPLPPPVRTPAVAPSSLAPAVVLSKPRLALKCSTPGEVGEGGRCFDLTKHTLITIRAGESLPAGTSLRIVGRGDIRAELPLAPMRKGQERRIKLPLDVCSGVVSSEVELQVLRRARANTLGQVVDTYGPYHVRC